MEILNNRCNSPILKLKGDEESEQASTKNEGPFLPNLLKF
jgi:hypothetical protein